MRIVATISACLVASSAMARDTWLSEYQNFKYADKYTTLQGVSPYGQIGIVGASRSSDTTEPNNAIGVGAYAIQDDPSNTKAAHGLYAHGSRYPGCSGTYGAEITIANLGDPVDVNPYTPLSAGHTYGAIIMAGGEPAQWYENTVNNNSAALLIGKNGSGNNASVKHGKGIVFESASLAGCDGSTGTCIAAEFGRGMTLAWKYATGPLAYGMQIRSDGNSASQQTRLVSSIYGMDIRGVTADYSTELPLLRVVPNNNAVNYVTIRGGISGQPATIAVQGSDADAGLKLEPKAGGNVFIMNLPTSDPQKAGALWNDNGTLKVSNG